MTMSFNTLGRRAGAEYRPRAPIARGDALRVSPQHQPVYPNTQEESVQLRSHVGAPITDSRSWRSARNRATAQLRSAFAAVYRLPSATSSGRGTDRTQSSSSFGTLPPFSAIFRSTVRCSQMFSSAEPSLSYGRAKLVSEFFSRRGTAIDVEQLKQIDDRCPPVELLPVLGGQLLEMGRDIDHRDRLLGRSSRRTRRGAPSRPRRRRGAWYL